MPRKAYGWKSGAPPEIAPHSLAKHRILREYIEQYLEVVTVNPAMDSVRITLVDGFAGGGEYVDPRTSTLHPGSPLILLDAVRASEARINLKRTKPLKIDGRYFFIEKDPTVATYLREVLRKRGDAPETNAQISVLEGAFEDRLDPIIASIKSRGRAGRAIFLLDQYGYTGVPMRSLQRIFSELPKAEVFLTLAVGWMTAYLPTAGVAAERLGIRPEVMKRLAALTEADFDVADPLRRPDLLAIQQLLHYASTTEVGSTYYTPFFIISRESNRPYWFLHMANSARAHDVVKELHWKIENNFTHYGSAGLSMLGYDPAEDPEVTGQMAFDFNDAARARTRASLIQDIPRRLNSKFSAGVKFGNLVEATCNETPATRALVAEVVRELCMQGDVEKRGGEGERRAITTLPLGDDLVRVARQGILRF